MGNKKRGIAVAISVGLMLVALLFLVSSVSHYSSMIGENNAWLANIASAAEQQDTAAWGVKRITEEYCMRATLSGANVTFSQNLNSIDACREAIQGWAKFMKGYGANSTALYAGEAELSKIYVYPQNLTVQRVNGTDSIMLSRGNATVKRYNATLTVLGSTVVDVSGAAHMACDSAGALQFEAHDAWSGQANSTCVDFAQAGQIRVFLEGGQNATVRLENGSVTVDFVRGRNVYLTLAAELDSVPSGAELGAYVRTISGAVGTANGVQLS